MLILVFSYPILILILLMLAVTVMLRLRLILMLRFILMLRLMPMLIFALLTTHTRGHARILRSPATT